jgi:hypothetical protein
MKPAPEAPKPSGPKDSDVVVVDLGTKKRKQVKQLRRGKGKLMDRVKQVLEELRASGTLTGSAQPIVIVVKEEMEPFNFMRMMRMGN